MGQLRNKYGDLSGKPAGKRGLGKRENCLVKCLMVKKWVEECGVD